MSVSYLSAKYKRILKAIVKMQKQRLKNGMKYDQACAFRLTDQSQLEHFYLKDMDADALHTCICDLHDYGYLHYDLEDKSFVLEESGIARIEEYEVLVRRSWFSFAASFAALLCSVISLIFTAATYFFK